MDITALIVYSSGAGDTNLLAGTSGGVFLSTNNGTSWTAANSGLPKNMDDTTKYISVTGFSFSPNGAGGTNLFAGTRGGGIFLSTNDGTSWNAVDSGLTNNDVRCLAVSGKNLFAGTHGGGVFFSKNNGTSWTAVNSGMTDTLVRSLAVSGASLFAGTQGSGVWKRPLSEMATLAEGHLSNMPGLFGLSQNYPNPFNPTTAISYQLPAVSHVTLKVYNLLGQEVATLADEVKQAGFYTANWDASSFSSGVYFYRLQTGSFVQTKKLILMK